MEDNISFLTGLASFVYLIIMIGALHIIASIKDSCYKLSNNRKYYLRNKKEFKEINNNIYKKQEMLKFLIYITIAITVYFIFIWP